MDDLGRLVGNGIASLVASAFAAIGGAIRGVAATLDAAIPWGLLPVVAFVGLLGAAWVLARR